MGNCLKAHDIYDEEPSLQSMRTIFESLQLTPHDVSRLFRMFCTFDTDRSGLVNTHELFATLAKDSVNFRDRVFALFDEDNSGQIDFREYVLTLWNYCTLSKTSLVIFAFDLYDTASAGSLSMNDVDAMITDLYGDSAATHPQAQQIRKVFVSSFDKNALITVQVFQTFVRNHPALLFPAFQMQLALQEHILGRNFWEKCAKKRVKLSNGKQVGFDVASELNIRFKGKLFASATTVCPSESPEEEEARKNNEEVAKILQSATGTLHHRRIQRIRSQSKLHEYAVYTPKNDVLEPAKQSATKDLLSLSKDNKAQNNRTNITSTNMATLAVSSINNGKARNVHNDSNSKPISRSVSPIPSRNVSRANSPMVSPRPRSQAEAHLYDHFLTPSHLLPSVQAQFRMHQEQEHHHDNLHHRHDPQHYSHLKHKDNNHKVKSK